MGGNGWLLGVHDAEEVASPDFGDVFLGVAHFQQSHGDVDHVVVAIESGAAVLISEIYLQNIAIGCVCLQNIAVANGQ